MDTVWRTVVVECFGLLAISSSGPAQQPTSQGGLIPLMVQKELQLRGAHDPAPQTSSWPHCRYCSVSSSSPNLLQTCRELYNQDARQKHEPPICRSLVAVAASIRRRPSSDMVAHGSEYSHSQELEARNLSNPAVAPAGPSSQLPSEPADDQSKPGRAACLNNTVVRGGAMFRVQ